MASDPMNPTFPTTNGNGMGQTAGGFAGTTGFDPAPATTAGGYDGHPMGLKDKALDAADGVRDQAMKLKDQALDSARSAASEGKDRAAEAISGVADTVRQTADQLGQNATIAPFTKYGAQAAAALEDFAGTLREKEIDELFDDVAGFVRRNPAIAIGAAVAAGFAIMQLLGGKNRMAARDSHDLGISMGDTNDFGR